MNYTDEKKLAQSAQSGDRRAFSALITHYKSSVYAICLSYLADFDQAEDLAQETFIKAYFRLHSLRDPARFGNWLRIIAANECRMHLRRTKTSPPLAADQEIAMDVPEHQLPADELAELPARRAAEEELRVTTLYLLNHLSENNRQVLILRYLGGRSVRSIGEFLDLKPAAVRQRLHRARQELKEEALQTVKRNLERRQLDPDFEKRVDRVIDAVKGGDLERVRQLIDADLSLIDARVPSGQSLLFWTAHNVLHGSQNQPIVDLLLEEEAQIDIFTATLLNRIDEVKTFLALDPALVQIRDEGRYTPLHWAAHGGHTELAELLLNCGADVDARNWQAATPLHMAAEFGHDRVLELLLDRGADIEAKVDYCVNARGMAEFHGHQTTAELLRARGAQTDIFSAAALGKIEELQILIAADPGLVHARAGDLTPVFGALACFQHEAARLLVEAGAELDLFSAAALGAQDRVEALIGADPELVHARYQGFALPFWSLLYGQGGIAAYLLSRGASLDIFAAIVLGHMEQVQALLRQSPKLLHARIGSIEPLHLAVYFGRAAMVELFLAHRPQLDVFTAAALGAVDRLEALLDENPKLLQARLPGNSSRDWTPLHWAVFNQQERSARLLLDRGAQPDIFVAAGLDDRDLLQNLLDAKPELVAAVDITARTPLHWAAHNDCARAVACLLSRRAEREARAHDGATPLQLAIQSDARKVLSLLNPEKD